MSRPFFMHIHIHSQTQRCTIRGWQRPTERGERMAQESTGSERTCGAAAWIIVE
ncbi:conserved hypothetical protein [Ricinus communis]|uniref:Uncharacterized protein n=1 Tax=Ricinus communis TaxID=3988 RepID=B9TAH8_RICCO|nr:conserved hypothetical protein [Ricinus communis]EEF27134.1 conserved hypothetical protein [Ricinus communis]